MRSITIDEVMNLKPCYSRGEILKMTGDKTTMTLIEIAQCEAISNRDRLWVLVQLFPERTNRLLACDFAEHTLPIFEAERPNDKRPREAIETARKFANGEATEEEMAAAWAARDAAGAAAGAAARDAAGAAAWAAAAWAAGAAEAAEDAAWDAAGAAARDAAGDAAGAAAGAAEQQWQIGRVVEVLGDLEARGE